MTNLLVIVAAKTVLLAALVLWLRVPRRDLLHAVAVGVPVGTAFGLAFFALFYGLVKAIDYHAPLTWVFVAVNAALSYGATATTVALLPLDLAKRRPGEPLGRERAYFSSTVAVCVAVFALTGSDFLRAFCIGAILMSAVEAAALCLGRAGPVSRMLRRDFRPMAALLAATAGLGVFYEALNLVVPVWDWVTLADMAAVPRTGLMMAAGYIVLIHPLFVAVRLVGLQFWPPAPAPAKFGWGSTHAASERADETTQREEQS